MSEGLAGGIQRAVASSACACAQFVSADSGVRQLGRGRTASQLVQTAVAQLARAAKPCADRRIRTAASAMHALCRPQNSPQVMLLLLPGSCPRPGKVHSRERSVKASIRGGACL